MLLRQKIPILRLANSPRPFVFALSRRLVLTTLVVISLVLMTHCARQTTIRLSGSEVEFEYSQRDSSMLRGRIVDPPK